MGVEVSRTERILRASFYSHSTDDPTGDSTPILMMTLLVILLPFYSHSTDDPAGDSTPILLTTLLVILLPFY